MFIGFKFPGVFVLLRWTTLAPAWKPWAIGAVCLISLRAPQAISAKDCSVSAKAKKSGKTKTLAKDMTVSLKAKAGASAKTALGFAKVGKAGGKLITVNAKTGKVTLKKGLKAGKYKVKVKLTAAASKNYGAAKAKTITLAVTVK